MRHPAAGARQKSDRTSRQVPPCTAGSRNACRSRRCPAQCGWFSRRSPTEAGTGLPAADRNGARGRKHRLGQCLRRLPPNRWPGAKIRMRCSRANREFRPSAQKKENQVFSLCPAVVQDFVPQVRFSECLMRSLLCLSYCPTRGISSCMSIQHTIIYFTEQALNNMSKTTYITTSQYAFRHKIYAIY